MSLRLVDVCKSFKVGNEVSFNLKKVNISFGDKGFYAITGQSGCGKTTLLNLITGIEKCDGGKIYYFEKEIKNFESFRMQNIGMIFQSYNVLKDYSGLFNYQIPLFEDNKIDKSKIYEKHNLSKDTIKKECKYLSGGEKQRISLCRAIVKKPSIIICDEPTGSLDEDNSVIVMQELKKLSKNKLVIMVSHNDKLVKRYADTIFHFENGKIIEEINKTRGENENNVSKIQYEKKESFFECIIALKRIKNNFGRFILLSIVMTISMFVATFACTISNNFVTYSENEKKNFADYNVVSICKIQKRKIENSLLSFSKTTRPTLNDMQGITSLAPNSEIYVDLNGLLRPNFYFLNGDKIGQEVRFVPLFNIDKYSINQVAVNNIFLKKYNCNKVKLKINNYSLSIDDMICSFVLEEELRIIKEIEEATLFNTPAIFYNYYAYSDLLNNMNISSEKNESWLEYIKKCNGDDPISNYSYLLISNEKEIMDIIKLLDSTNKSKFYFQTDNNAIRVSKALSSLRDVISLICQLFLILIFISFFIVNVVVGYSDVFLYKKESAILYAMGIKKNKIFKSFFIKNGLALVLSSLISLFLSSVVTYVANKFTINGVELSFFFQHLYFYFLLILILSVIVTYVISNICFHFECQKGMSQELRNE